jgi:hypothetical protein
MDEAFQKTIDAIQAQLRPLEDEIVLKKRLINQICDVAGAPRLYQDSDLEVTAAPSQVVRSDQFFGQPLATSVKFILQQRKARGSSAIPLDELCETLKSGGYQFDNKNEAIARRNVAITLGKNPAFMRVPSSGDIGLAEWYPAAKRNKANGRDEPEESTEEEGHAKSTDQLMNDIIEGGFGKPEKSP